MTLEEIAAQLYQLPAEDFTARRDALAKELAGTPLAKDVARLPKPTAAARALNIYANEHPKQLADLFSTAAGLRHAQDARDAAAVRDLTAQANEQLRALLADLPDASPALLGQAEQTLRAAMSDERAADAVRAGLLIKALEPGGFGAVDLAGAVAGTPAHVDVPPASAKRSAAPPDPGPELMAKVAEAQELLQQSEAELTSAEQAAELASSRTRELTQQLDQARQDERAATQGVRAARSARDDAARRARTAAKKLDDAIGAVQGNRRTINN